MKLSLNQKIIIGFAACAIALIVVAIYSFQNSQEAIVSNNEVDHTHQVLYEFDQILLACIDAETGMRGYVITGNDAFLEPYNSSRQRAVAHLDKVTNLTTANAQLHQNIAELRAAVNEMLELRATQINQYKSEPQKIIEEIKQGRGKQLQDAIRNKVTAIRQTQSDELTLRQQKSKDDTSTFQRLFIALLVVILAALVSVYIIITLNLRALRKAQQESENKNWLLAGNFEINEKIRGEREVNELAQEVINHLCPYLNAQIGTVYLSENGQLRMVASYAFHVRKQNITSINIGEGLVGQAALEKKPIIFTEVPDDYIKINSGLGNTAPKNILVLPLVQDGIVRGALEIGTLDPFNDLDMQFLNMISENLAIVFNAAQSRAKMRELLEETQRQAEELETQQEELRQTNEELQEKTDLLEKSEAELKMQQEELQQTNEELEEKANLLEDQKSTLELTKMEIENKARDLEVVSKYKSEFLANMSHELRTPLNSILILAQLLNENKNNTLGEKEVAFAKNIHSSGADLLNLINEILDLSKVEAGKMDLYVDQVSFSTIQRSLKQMFTEVANSKSVNFDIRIEDPSIQTLTTDKQRLEQILRNLLSNAFKFTRSNGKVALTIGPAPAKAVYRKNSLSTVDRVIAFRVTDTGIGIPREKQSVIFEAFQQGDGSTKRKYGGTGLGLSISRELANALGGEIQLDSREGEGSTFTLFLPAQYAHPTPAASESQASSRQKPERKNETTLPVIDLPAEIEDDRSNIRENDKVVLILEDDIHFASLLLSFVRERGYKVVIALQGNTGLSYARHFKPDAILLDMKLPVMDGSEVLRHLKNDPSIRHIPVQIISGYDRRKEGLELGAFDFLHKPVTTEALQQTFDRIEDFVGRKFKKLLIVEDNELQNNVIKELIGNGDVKCFSSYSGEEAYDALQKERFDCMIVDLGLPDMTGFDLLEKIKDNDKINKIPTIVYTGKDLTRDEASRLNKLASTVVLKTADSKERLLDETTLFLHRVESALPMEKQNLIRKLHKSDEVLKDKKVLVVDDDMRNIYSLTNALQDAGMNCLIAENGKVALKMLGEKKDIDIVLMDVMMPEMDGYEATREIRKTKKFEKLPVIALTAKAMKGDREKCLGSGMSDYVSKPVNIEQLLSLMRVWLYA